MDQKLIYLLSLHLTSYIFWTPCKWEMSSLFLVQRFNTYIRRSRIKLLFLIPYSGPRKQRSVCMCMLCVHTCVRVFSNAFSCPWKENTNWAVVFVTYVLNTHSTLPQSCSPVFLQSLAPLISHHICLRAGSMPRSLGTECVTQLAHQTTLVTVIGTEMGKGHNQRWDSFQGYCHGGRCSSLARLELERMKGLEQWPPSCWHEVEPVWE